MLNSQAKELVLQILNARSFAGDIDPVEESELSIDIFRRSKKDGLCMSISVRCFEGYLTVYRNGDLVLEDDDNHTQQICNQVEISQWLRYTFKLNPVR